MVRFTFNIPGWAVMAYFAIVGWLGLVFGTVFVFAIGLGLLLFICYAVVRPAGALEWFGQQFGITGIAILAILVMGNMLRFWYVTVPFAIVAIVVMAIRARVLAAQLGKSNGEGSVFPTTSSANSVSAARE